MIIFTCEQVCAICRQIALENKTLISVTKKRGFIRLLGGRRAVDANVVTDSLLSALRRW